MELETFKQRLKNLQLSLIDFGEMTSLSYSAVSKFGKTNPIPPWVDSYLSLLEENKNLNEVKKLIIELSDKIRD
ncbi:MAG: hypothetical protein Q7S59_07050 [Sulfurimonas sp.]|nr:hypothetical protein [Sulfurimonas sp.]